jgi:2-polyprenyl-3-methyl-5-hydroxy-6-metoxy-1,4-benzoquinol methylase
MNCKICNAFTVRLGENLVLKKFRVEYFKCNTCGFIQTEEPYWLDEAYASAITTLDLGLLQRNLFLLPITSAIILKFFNPSSSFVDFGGGYGVFTRIMRDKGFDFYRQDPHCENIFAKQFDVIDLDEKHSFEMLTAFEVFEHLVDPQKELEKMLQYSDSILFSTELIPANVKKDWWYFSYETGQHIALYTNKSLAHLAKKNNLNYYSNGSNIHLFSRKKINPFLFKILVRYKPASLFVWLSGKKETLLLKDYELVKDGL